MRKIGPFRPPVHDTSYVGLPMPDPASGMEMDPEFVRLVRLLRQAVVRQEYDIANDCATALHRWHLAAVERAVTKAIMEERALHTRLAVQPDRGEG